MFHCFRNFWIALFVLHADKIYRSSVSDRVEMFTEL